MVNIKELEKLKIVDPKISKDKYIGSIYVLYNTQNSKVYVGKTIQDYRKRFYRHKSNAKLQHLEFLYNAIRKYGWDNFEKFIIFQTEEVDDKNKIIDLINDKETYYISLFKSNQKEFGYNICSGGEGKTGTINNNCSISILQCDLKGNIIKEWPSMHEVERQLGFSNKQISYFIYSDKRKSSYKGYLWIKKSDYSPDVFKDYHSRDKKVFVFDSDGNFIKDFSSANKASKELKLDLSNICNCCNGTTLTVGKYIALYDKNIQTRLEQIKNNSKVFNKILNKNKENVVINRYDFNGNFINSYILKDLSSKYSLRPSKIISILKKENSIFYGSVIIEETLDSIDNRNKKLNMIKTNKTSYQRALKQYYKTGYFQE